MVIHAAREQEIDGAEQIELRRRERVLAGDLHAGLARREARADVRHAVEPHEATAAVALEAEERARPVILERSREHTGPARDRRRGHALALECAHGGVGDAQLHRGAAHRVVTGQATRHAY